jgi:hypothetical protein
MINKEKTCQLIDIAIPDDSDVNTIEAEKPSKYKVLEIEVSRIWNVRTKIVLIIIAALGTIKKRICQNLQLLPDHLAFVELQKITLMSTVHII